MNKAELKTLNIFQKFIQKTKSLNFKLNKIKDKSGKTSFLSETSRTIIAPTSKNEVKDIPVSDNELKTIYKQIVEREEQNKKKKINYISPKNFLNKTQEMGVGLMLQLQEKILKIKNKRDKMNQKIENKIINITSKDKDRILMNEQKDVLIIKGKSFDKEINKFNLAHKNLDKIMKNWIYNLRKNQQEEKKRKIFSPKEIIYSNKNLTFSRNKSDINIRKQLFKKISISNSINMNKEQKVKQKKINTNNSMSLNSAHNLFIQGKNLLNQEIKLSKKLQGKKKKLFHYSFVPKEISSILLAKSISKENVTTPKAIINSMEIHKFA